MSEKYRGGGAPLYTWVMDSAPMVDRLHMPLRSGRNMQSTTALSAMSSSCRHRDSPRRLSCSVDPTMSVNGTVASTCSLVETFTGPQTNSSGSVATELPMSEAA
jgi:hypothetical protein